jgi:hypothetical protein
MRPESVRNALRFWFVGPESSDGEQRMYCPVCEDPEKSASPSAMVNPEQSVWNCLKGNHGGKVDRLIKQMKEDSRLGVAKQEEAASGKEPPSPLAVAQWHAELLNEPELLNEFSEHRALSYDSVLEYEIGYDQTAGRYTIPVYDAKGRLVNVRKYRMGASEQEQKFWNLSGHGEARIFQPQELRNTEWVVLAEGELDCLVLLERGFPTVSGTGGSGTFKPEWAELFTDLAVYVAYDADDAGDKGSVKVGNVLRNFASVVYRVKLPERGTDVTDFFAGKGTPDEFEKFLAAAKRAGSRTSRSLDDMPKTGVELSLLDSMSDAAQGEPIELTVSIVGKQQEPFTAPKRIVASCDMQKGAPCERCPLMARNGEVEVLTQPHDSRLMQFVDVPIGTAHRLLRMMTGARCGDHVEFDVEELWRVEELAVQPSVDERRDQDEDRPVRRTVWSVGKDARTSTNEKRRFIGANVPDPKSGMLKFHSWHSEPVELDIDKFALTPEMRQQLEIFQPRSSETSLEKCLEIAGDLSDNVTGIIGRDLLHVGMDLVYHSPIALTVGGRDVDKGWLEMMVVGDTRTGKSEIATQLMRYYRSGKLVSCEGVTFAGLIGGVQQIGTRWHMTWGVIPMNDRRLVILDEVSGMGERNVIEQMSSVRSAGVAQITKIVTESTSARTRLIWITNPQSGGFLSEHQAGGVGALQSVVRNNEDIARFDFVMAAARGDVRSEDINTTHEPGLSAYSAEDCELLVRWAWSHSREDVVITDTAIEAASKAAIELGNRYSPHPPLVQAENVRFKVLRIAAALAARTFSVRKNGGLIVKREHVQSAVDFLDMIYGQDSLGYGRMSAQEGRRVERSTNMLDNARLMMLDQPAILATLHMSSGEFKVRDFAEFQGMPEAAASQVVSTLHEWGLVQYSGARGVFRMTAQLIRLVREMREEEDGR